MATVALTPAQILAMPETGLLAAVGAELVEIEPVDPRFLGAVEDADDLRILVPATLPPAARTLVVRVLVARLAGAVMPDPRGVEVAPG